MHHDNNLVRKKNSVVSNIECIERYIHYVKCEQGGKLVLPTVSFFPSLSRNWSKLITIFLAQIKYV